MEKKLEFEPSSITKSLADISLIMNEGHHFVKIRDHAEKWKKESEQGKESSQALIDTITRFERLIKIITGEQGYGA